VRALYGARYEPDSLGWAESAYIGIRGESVAEQTRLDPFDTTVPAYTLAHADAGLTVPVEAHPLALDVGVHNLFDKSYRDFMSRFKTYALAPGRNITVRLTMHF
jgi:iron complex outermembrane receptor protein